MHNSTDRVPGALSLSRTVLRALVFLNIVYGLGILALLIASFVAPELAFEGLGVKDAPDRHVLVRGMRLIMGIGIAGAGIAHFILTRLGDIVATVGTGNPFVVDNADRLQRIAWAVLALEVLHLLVGWIARGSASASQPLDINWSFSFTPWIAVLLLFVLARVFDQGARMRADLEGTV
jgi:peptidoglycan biosynthesis protein MviN/MurJ (putative lipid II flippase)